MLNNGHHRIKRRKGGKNCFYCQHDVSTWEELTWPQVKAIYNYCNLPCPAAICCKECAKKPDQELYEIFWQYITAIECKKFKENKPSIIRDKKICKQLLDKLKGRHGN